MRLKIIYNMYKYGLALNKQQRLICQKKPNQT